MYICIYTHTHQLSYILAFVDSSVTFHYVGSCFLQIEFYYFPFSVDTSYFLGQKTVVGFFAFDLVVVQLLCRMEQQLIMTK